MWFRKASQEPNLKPGFMTVLESSLKGGYVDCRMCYIIEAIMPLSSTFYLDLSVPYSSQQRKRSYAVEVGLVIKFIKLNVVTVVLEG